MWNYKTPGIPDEYFESPTAAARVIEERSPVPLREAAPGVARQLDTIVMKTLRKLSDQRYQSVRDLSLDVQRYLDGKVAVDSVEATVRAEQRWPAGVKTRVRAEQVWLLMDRLEARGFSVPLPKYEGGRAGIKSELKCELLSEHPPRITDSQFERAWPFLLEP